MNHRIVSIAFLILAVAGDAVARQALGYYRQTAFSKDHLVFVAEGDLRKASPSGGKASRLTTHASEEQLPAISPDQRYHEWEYTRRLNAESESNGQIGYDSFAGDGRCAAAEGAGVGN